MGVLSISSFPLNKPLQRMQDSPLRGLTSWLLLACSPSQEARLRGNSNKPDLSRNNLLPHQHLRLRDTRVTPAGANSAAWRQPQHQASPGASQQPRDYSCGYSCGAPHISQLLQTITNRLLHFSSVATRASVTFFCIIAFLCFLSSLPGFLIQSALYVVLATSLLRLPLPTVLAGHLLYSAISFLHPVCALFLLLP